MDLRFPPLAEVSQPLSHCRGDGLVFMEEPPPGGTGIGVVASQLMKLSQPSHDIAKSLRRRMGPKVRAARHPGFKLPISSVVPHQGFAVKLCYRNRDLTESRVEDVA